MTPFPIIAKLSLFAIIALLSIYPTRQFLSWRADVKQGRALMARGIGYVSAS
jgi:putative membrane protein